MGSNNIRKIKRMIDILLVFLIILSIIFIQNVYLNALFIIILSLVLFYRVRKIRILILIIGLIAYVNLSIAIIDVFFGHSMFPSYQHLLRNSIEHEILINSTLIIIIVLFILINPKTIHKMELAKINITNCQYNNTFIFILLSVYLVFTLLFGFNRDISVYGGNSSAIYEYSIFVLLFMWFAMGNKTHLKIMFYTFALMYILQGLYYGDRSSSLIFLILLLSLIMKNISIKKIVFGLIAVILIGNLVSTYRDSFGFNFNTLISISTYYKGPFTIFLDTSSYSFYSGLTIIASKMSLGDTTGYLMEFILSIFLGAGGLFTKNADISTFANSLFPNPGGGFYPSYFYFFGGYIGVIIGGAILSGIIRLIFLRSSKFFILMRFALFAMSFRWYIYGPINLFRSVLFFFPILYILISVIDNLLRTNSND